HRMVASGRDSTHPNTPDTAAMTAQAPPLADNSPAPAAASPHGETNRPPAWPQAYHQAETPEFASKFSLLPLVACPSPKRDRARSAFPTPADDRGYWDRF